MLAALDGALALATAAPPELAPRTVPWVHAVAALALTGALVLIPRPAPAPPLLRRVLAEIALALALILALALTWLSARRSAAPPAYAPPTVAPGAARAGLEVPAGWGIAYNSRDCEWEARCARGGAPVRRGRPGIGRDL